MDSCSTSGESSQRRERQRERESQKRRSQQKEEQGTRRGVFPMFCGSGRPTKAAGAEPSGGMRDKQLHAGVVRSRFASQKAKSIARPEHFWQVSC